MWQRAGCGERMVNVYAVCGEASVGCLGCFLNAKISYKRRNHVAFESRDKGDVSLQPQGMILNDGSGKVLQQKKQSAS